MRISDERLKVLTGCFGIVAASDTDPVKKAVNLDTYHALAELMVRRQYGQEYIDELILDPSVPKQENGLGAESLSR